MFITIYCIHLVYVPNVGKSMQFSSYIFKILIATQNLSWQSINILTINGYFNKNKKIQLFYVGYFSCGVPFNSDNFKYIE